MPKLKNFLRCIFLGLFFLTSTVSNGCTIFIANDGRHVWIGNNEDGLQHLTYRIWYHPARRHNYGYAVWTEQSMGLLNAFSYINPQGGMNEYGLFLDFATIDEIAVTSTKGKPDRKKQVVTEILKTCKTVDEAVAFLKKFNLVKLNKAQLFIADASGDYVTVTGAGIVRKTTNSFAVTNYPIANQNHQACHRRDVATQYLSSTETFELEDVKGILERSSQRPPNDLISNYSMAVDLKAGTIYLYYKTDFNTVSTISLRDEIKKGKHHKSISSYFPKSIVLVLEKQLTKGGIASMIEVYRTLRTTHFDEYNFTNRDALDLAVRWIQAEKTNQAIELLNCLLDFDRKNADLYAWLGVAFKRVNIVNDSKVNFTKSFAIDPDNYVATLFGKQLSQTVTFRLPDFEGAEHVSLMGEFTGWTKHPIPMKKEAGFWTCSMILPQGAVIYKFLVNDQYLADSKNLLHTGSGPDVFSKVYVW